MIIELIGLFAAFGGTELVGRIANERFPRPTYSALVGWWWGSFAEDSPGALLASMIDSDLNCDQWKIEQDTWYGHDYVREKYDILESEAYKAKISYHPKGRVRLSIQDKSGKWNEHKVTAYEDYLLVDAKKNWKSRKARNEVRRIHKDCMDTINERVTQNYMDTLTMIEQRILHSDTTVTDPNLRALLPAPDHPVPAPKIEDAEYELVDDGFRTYRKPIEKKQTPMQIEHKKRVNAATTRRKKLASQGIHDVW